MTKEQLDKFENNLNENGYVKYGRSKIDNEDYYWCKSFGKSEYEDSRSNYQILFRIYDFTPYIHYDNAIKIYPYSVSILVMVSRTVNERIDLTFNFDENISEVERKAYEFFKFAEKNMSVPED